MVTMSSTFRALGDLLQSKPVIVYLALVTHYLLHIFDFTIAFYLVLRGWALAFAGLAAIIYTTGQHAGSIAATVQITATVASVYFSVLTASILIYRGFFHRLRKVCLHAIVECFFSFSFNIVFPLWFSVLALRGPSSQVLLEHGSPRHMESIPASSVLEPDILSGRRNSTKSISQT